MNVQLLFELLLAEVGLYTEILLQRGEIPVDVDISELDFLSLERSRNNLRIRCITPCGSQSRKSNR